MTSASTRGEHKASARAEGEHAVKLLPHHVDRSSAHGCGPPLQGNRFWGLAEAVLQGTPLEWSEPLHIRDLDHHGAASCSSCMPRHEAADMTEVRQARTENVQFGKNR